MGEKVQKMGVFFVVFVFECPLVPIHWRERSENHK